MTKFCANLGGALAEQGTILVVDSLILTVQGRKIMTPLWCRVIEVMEFPWARWAAKSWLALCRPRVTCTVAVIAPMRLS